jgi:hypothetical protein
VAGASLSQSPNGLLGSATELINAGKTAANYAENVTSGLKNISDTIGSKGLPNSSGLNSALGSLTGLVSSTFTTIADSLPKLKAGVPQNLSAIASESEQAINNQTSGVAETQGSASGLGVIQGGAKSIINTVNKSVDDLGSAFKNITASSLLDTQNNSALSILNQQVTAGGMSLKDIVNPNSLQDGFDKVQTALGAISSGGPSPSKIPTVATDTYSRGALTAQISALLGNAKIPAPNYGGNSATFNEQKSESLLKDQVSKAKAKEELINQLDEAYKVSDELNAAWADAVVNLPVGDPEIERRKSALVKSIENCQALYNKIYYS